MNAEQLAAKLDEWASNWELDPERFSEVDSSDDFGNSTKDLREAAKLLRQLDAQVKKADHGA